MNCLNILDPRGGLPSSPFNFPAALNARIDGQAAEHFFAAQLQHSLPGDVFAKAGTGSRRRKLWELPHDFHWPLMGACFRPNDLRKLVARLINPRQGDSDFVLHIQVAEACATRSELAEVVHRQLETRYSATIRQFTAAKDAESVARLWREVIDQGMEIPAALWASWTHPACDALLEQQIHGDIHMIQLQLAHGEQEQSSAVQQLQVDNAQLSRALDEARRELASLRRERSRQTDELAQQVAKLRVDLAGKEARIVALGRQLDEWRSSLPDLKDRQGLARQLADANRRESGMATRLVELEFELERLRKSARNFSTGIAPAPAAAHLSAPVLPPKALSGKCVLCVGGRSGAVDAYRQIVEKCGGRFLHHDGGMEETLHRIDGALNAADLVVCQSGCISHNAYWRVKEQCKRSGKQCLYVKGSGLSSFGRAVHAACETLDLAQ